MTYLFYLTFGPIQTFIEQSRKTRDLHAASQILSQLAKAAVNEVKEQKGTLIIPQDSDSLPNYLLAKFSAEPNQIGEVVKNALCNKFEEIARQACKRTGERKPADFDGQIKEHLDIHWAFVEVQTDYDSAYKNLQSIVASLKNTRIFSQIKEGVGECGRKCSLDGERNALFYHKNSDRKKPPYICLNNAVEINNSKLRPNEGLSAVSLVKRYYKPQEKTQEFPSTAAIALMHWCEVVQKIPEGMEALDTLQNCVDIEDWDAQLLFKENLTVQYFEKNGLTGKEKLPELQKQLEILDKLPFKKTRYYALLKYDGDKMGEHLSGINLPNKTKLREFHQELSKKLAEFAKHAREEILIPPQGKTVYAGGDDFLGFVNLHSVFSIAKQLRIEFDEQVNKPIEKEFKLEKPLTFSAGIVIAHYKTPLHIVLHNATDLLKTIAKKKLDRNAFAIRLLKHSGESHECGFKWELEKKDTPLKDLQLIIEQLKENFSTNFIQVLNQEMRLLHQAIVATNVIKAEIKRLVGRSAKKDNLDGEKDELIEALNRLRAKAKPTENFLETLNVCKFMHREIG